MIGSPGVRNDLILKNAISKGVMSTEATINGVPYFQLGISINPGNSGGPVLDTSGDVIGVVTLKAANKEGLGFCIPFAQLKEKVANLKSLPEAAEQAKPAAPSQPTPVRFDIAGMRIGDRATEEFAYKHFPAKDKGKLDIDGHELTVR